MSRTHRRHPDEVGSSRRSSSPDSDVFRCQHCRAEIVRGAQGTEHRNHCPHCLWSVHLDERPGDRRSACRGGMEPIAIWVRPDGEWALVALPPFPVSRLRR
jgi:hypothetical protein